MELLPVGEFKAKFSKILQKVQQGATFGITFGKAKKKVAVVMPFDKAKAKKKRQLGIWEGKGSFKLAKDFKMTIEEFLSS